MKLLPAIDIINQQPVRLYQGDYNRKEVVGQSVLEIAKSFEQAGADMIHLVDLDGAKSGKKENAPLICQVAQSVNVPVEIGGGIRSMEDIDYYLSQGVSRVILGTKALQDKTFLEQALEKYKEKIAVGMECKDGYVCGSGWLETSDIYYLDFAKEMEQMGVQTIIFTDISTDGTLQGPNLDMLKKIQDTCSVDIVASGGIKDLTHIQQLKDLGVSAAIMGKAIYSKTLDLKEAIALCQEG